MLPEQTIKRLLIKQVTGRLLLDSAQRGCPFTLAQEGGRWIVTVEQVELDAADEIVRLIADLNLFYFEEDAINRQTRKWWLYDKDGPGYEWDAGRSRLTLSLDSRVAYSNESAKA